MRNNPKVDLTAYYDCINIANQLYDNGDYNAAIEKYKDSIVALKKPGFESILKIAKCNHKFLVNLYKPNSLISFFICI